MTRDSGPNGGCPLPIRDHPTVVLAHGGGGTLMHALLERLFLPSFRNPHLEARHDGAVLSVDGARIAFTTDSYVVRPLFFPGGDIGTLAVFGTVNDLAMCGARPLYLSAGFIIEEGFAMEALWRVVRSMRLAAEAASVTLVTGDTKVVDRGKGDGLYLNTAGVGAVEHDLSIAPSSVRTGDVVIASGDLGRHGVAILAVREGLAFETTVESDCAPLAAPVLDLLAERVEVHCLRDLTRGGLASALNEIAAAASLHVHVEEEAVLVSEEVRGACEILGLDPLAMANEGRFVAFVAPKDAERATAILRAHPPCAGARAIGAVTGREPGLVTVTSRVGASRILDTPSGEQLPRIC